MTRRLLMCVVLGSLLALTTVWEQVHALRMRYRLDSLRRQEENLEAERAVLRAEVSKLLTPAALARRAQSLALELGPPAPHSLMTPDALARQLQQVPGNSGPVDIQARVRRGVEGPRSREH